LQHLIDRLAADQAARSLDALRPRGWDSAVERSGEIDDATVADAATALMKAAAKHRSHVTAPEPRS
jgi:hypothetical protein